MNALIVKQRINRANRKMQIENMLRQSMAGWDGNYHLVSDFTNDDKPTMLSEILNTVLAIALFCLVMTVADIALGMLA